MKPDNVSKEFAGLVGDEWHELKEKIHTDGYPIYACVCRNRKYGNKGKEAFEIHCAMTNPAYYIETIKQAIQSVPCGECGGNGEIKTGEKCMNHQCLSFSPCAMSNGDKDDKFNCPMIKPCSCTDGSDDWIKLCGWIVKNEVYTLDDGRTILANLFNILTTPALLMQAYIAYRRAG